MDAIIHRAQEGRTGKRTASTEIPESVKATVQERRKKQSRILGLYAELEKHENIGSTLDDNIRQLVDKE